MTHALSRGKLLQFALALRSRAYRREFGDWLWFIARILAGLAVVAVLMVFEPLWWRDPRLRLYSAAWWLEALRFGIASGAVAAVFWLVVLIAAGVWGMLW